MAKEALFEAITEYSGTWRAHRVSKAYKKKRRYPVPPPVSRGHRVEFLHISDVHLPVESSPTSVDVEDASREFQIFYVCGTVGKSLYSSGLLWHRYATRQIETGFETQRLLLPEIFAIQEASPISAPWDWHFSKLANNPLVQYTVFFSSPREDALPFSSGKIKGAIQHQRISEAVDPWAQVCNEKLPVEARLQALHNLAYHDKKAVAHFIVSQLDRNDITAVWRNNLILFAEHVQFAENELRQRLSRQLLDYARSLRQSTVPGTAAIVHSAIRLYASLISQREAVSLLPLLEPPTPIETRLVTLHCIVHLFTPHPPGAELDIRPLSDRVSELADKFLDKDWLVAGEKAAIGQNATLALAALGDERLRQCIERIRSLGLGWLTRQVGRKLEMTLEGWQANAGPAPHPAIQLVHEQLEALRK